MPHWAASAVSGSDSEGRTLHIINGFHGGPVHDGKSAARGDHHRNPGKGGKFGFFIGPAQLDVPVFGTGQVDEPDKSAEGEPFDEPVKVMGDPPENGTDGLAAGLGVEKQQPQHSGQDAHGRPEDACIQFRLFHIFFSLSIRPVPGFSGMQPERLPAQGSGWYRGQAASRSLYRALARATTSCSPFFCHLA